MWTVCSSHSLESPPCFPTPRFGIEPAYVSPLSRLAQPLQAKASAWPLISEQEVPGPFRSYFPFWVPSGSSQQIPQIAHSILFPVSGVTSLTLCEQHRMKPQVYGSGPHEVGMCLLNGTHYIKSLLSGISCYSGGAGGGTLGRRGC